MTNLVSFRLAQQYLLRSERRLREAEEDFELVCKALDSASMYTDNEGVHKEALDSVAYALNTLESKRANVIDAEIEVYDLFKKTGVTVSMSTFKAMSF